MTAVTHPTRPVAQHQSQSIQFATPTCTSDMQLVITNRGVNREL